MRECRTQRETRGVHPEQAQVLQELCANVDLEDACQMSGYASASRVRDLGRILSDRDLRILATVARLRFISGSQLRRIHVTGGTPLGNERVTRRVLRRLVELGVLDRLERRIGGPTPGGSEGYVYLLASGGARLAYTRRLVARARRRKTAVPGQLFVRHALAIAELYTRLLEAQREGSFDRVEFQAEPSCWRRFRGPEGDEMVLKPDAFVRLSSGPREREYLIDVDRGTEGSRTLERRLHTYTLYRAWGSEYTDREFPRVLWLARSRKRVGVIDDVLDYLPSESRGVFTVAHFEDGIDAIRDLL